MTCAATHPHRRGRTADRDDAGGFPRRRSTSSVAGTADSVATALALVEAGGIDAAILDVNLRGGEKSSPVAEALAAQGIPFVFATGGGDDEHRRALPRPPAADKPFTMDGLEKALAASTLAARSRFGVGRLRRRMPWPVRSASPALLLSPAFSHCGGLCLRRRRSGLGLAGGRSGRSSLRRGAGASVRRCSGGSRASRAASFSCRIDLAFGDRSVGTFRRPGPPGPGAATLAGATLRVLVALRRPSPCCTDRPPKPRQ